MKTKNSLPFISLLLIAAMIFAPIIYALDGGSFSTVTDWSGGSFSDSSDGWSGGSFGTSADGWSGGSYGDYAGGWSGGSYSTETDGWSGGTEASYEPTTQPPQPITPPTGSYDYPDITDLPPGGPLPPTEPLPTNADAVWQDLPDVTILKASASGTILQRDVFSKCSDPDDANLEFKIATSSDEFELAFVNTDLRIFKLNPYYAGSKIITLTCNGAPESFFLHVVQRKTPTQPASESDDDGDGLSVHINTIRLPDGAIAGEQIPITITFKNNGNEKLENLKTTVIIQDLAIRASIGPIDLTRGKKASKTLYVELPEDVQPGTYYAKVMIDSNSLHRVKHRELIIE